jgi:hypothetical protein
MFKRYSKLSDNLWLLGKSLNRVIHSNAENLSIELLEKNCFRKYVNKTYCNITKSISQTFII